MDADKSVTATFNANYQAKVGTTFYSSLQTALDSAANGETVQALAYTFLEPILFNRTDDALVTIDGGLEAGYSASTGRFTNVSGSLRVQKGTIRVKGPLAVK
jgi:hypothetical protein